MFFTTVKSIYMLIGLIPKGDDRMKDGNFIEAREAKAQLVQCIFATVNYWDLEKFKKSFFSFLLEEKGQNDFVQQGFCLCFGLT